MMDWIMYMIAILASLSVWTMVIWELINEYIDEPFRIKANHDRIYGLERQNVIKGIFRQHNQAFKDHGLGGPKGTA